MSTMSVDPAWSPGGTMLAFSRWTGDRGGWEIFVRFADGSEHLLTKNPGDDRSPTWSPDGRSIAFTSDRSGNGDLYVMYFDVPLPLGDHQVTTWRVTTSPATDIDPAWSPDGKRLVYASNPTGQFDLFYISADLAACCGGGFISSDRGRLWPVGPDTLDDTAPAWSPDGSTLAWKRGANSADVMSLSPVSAGSSAQPLITDSMPVGAPAYSPDGQRILFTRASDTADVYVTGATDSATQLNLTPSSAQNDVAPDWQAIPAFPLVDVQFSPFAADIEWLHDTGITTGCSDERFCPRDDVLRGQMAAFLDRALDFDPTTEDYFIDDESSVFEDSINRLAAAGVTTGCGDATYCPTFPVQRGEMAAYLVRALDLPATVEDFFPDDEDSIFEDDINRLAAAGITTGSADGTYRPDGLVTRGEMAAFLHRALAP
jgi:dipeptidyl aminopeptidase/acylaminoacyl peptidase